MAFAFEVLLDPFSDKVSLFGEKKVKFLFLGESQSNFFWLMTCYGFFFSQDSVSSAWKARLIFWVNAMGNVITTKKLCFRFQSTKLFW